MLEQFAKLFGAKADFGIDGLHVEERVIVVAVFVAVLDVEEPKKK
jgi:hypothetical protein